MLNASRYEAYKNSGSEWLGDIPASWPMALLSQIVTQVKNKNSDLAEKNLLSLSYGRIKRKPIDTSGGLLPVSFDGYNIIEANDIVLRLTDLQNDHTSLRVGLSPERGIITSAYTTMRPKNIKGAKYLYYLLHTFDIRKGFYGMGSGVRQGLNYDEVKRLKLPLPTEEEQITIAAFLDKKIAHIDSVINEAKASIEEYKVWKASIIYEAVTKGLDPNAEMKDTGISGLGCVPVTWNVTNLKRLATIKTGGTLPKEENSPYYSTEEGLPWIKSENLGSSKPIHNTSEYYTEIALNDIKKFPPYSVYVCCIGSIGKVGFSDIECSCNQQINAVIFDKINWKFGYYAIMAQEEKHWLLSNGNVLKILNSTNQGTIEIAYPNNDEQLVIVNYLDDKCEKIELLISEKETLITELESYKKSLIFEVVTGKRRVC